MNHAAVLSRELSQAEVNEDFTEAVLSLRDHSRLCFCHRVGERWAKSVGPEDDEQQGGQADQLLGMIEMFRLNSKHLDILFSDGSRWDHAIQEWEAE